MNAIFFPKNKVDEKGYILLLSVIIIIAIASTLIFSLSYAGYFVRFNILNSTSKETSMSLATACAETALLNLAVSGSYMGNETIQVASSTCQIFPLQTQSGQKIITTKGVFQNATTNLKITTQQNPTLIIISWEEIPTL